MDTEIIIKKLDALKAHHGWRADEELAGLLGVSRQVISGWRHGKNISRDNFQTLEIEYNSATTRQRMDSRSDEDHRRRATGFLQTLDGDVLRAVAGIIERLALEQLQAEEVVGLQDTGELAKLAGLAVPPAEGVEPPSLAGGRAGVTSHIEHPTSNI